MLLTEFNKPQPEGRSKVAAFFISLGMLPELILYSFLSIGVSGRQEFAVVFAGITLLFFLYFFRFKYALFSENWALGFFLTRLPFFLSIPYLSDDFYRFYYDGLLSLNGINPYAFLPVDAPFERPEWFELLNSPRYYSVYPPIAQVIFLLVTFLASNSLWLWLSLFRIILVGAEWLTFKILANSNSRLLPLFIFNPLLIIESVGNLHFEILLVYFCTLAWMYKDKSVLQASLFWSISILIKIIPVLAIFWTLRWQKKGKQLILFTGILCLTSFLLAINFSFAHILQSIGLFIQQFEFNALPYYLLRDFGIYLLGYNPIQILGWTLKMASVALLMLYSNTRIPAKRAFYFILASYLLLSTVVHPWYLIPLLFLGLGAGRLEVLVWSYVVFLSYFAYVEEPVEESYWLLAVEYGSLSLAWFFRNKWRDFLLN